MLSGDRIIQPDAVAAAIPESGLAGWPARGHSQGTAPLHRENELLRQGREILKRAATSALRLKDTAGSGPFFLSRASLMV